MHKDVPFIIISPGPLCISTTWLGFFPFSSPRSNLMKDHPILLLMNHIPIGASTLSSHFHPTTIHQLWPHTVVYPQDSSPIQNFIYVPLRHIHLTDHTRFRHTIATTLRIPAQHRVHPLYQSILTPSRTHIQNLDHCRTYQKLHQERQFRYLSDQNKEAAHWMIHNLRRNPKQRRLQPPALLTLMDPLTHIIHLWITMIPMIQIPVTLTAWQNYGPTKQWWHPNLGNLGVKQHQKLLHR